MSHTEFVSSEHYRSPSERAWDTWIARVECLIHGKITPAPDLMLSDEAELALEAFDEGCSAEDHAIDLIARLGDA